MGKSKSTDGNRSRPATPSKPDTTGQTAPSTPPANSNEKKHHHGAGEGELTPISTTVSTAPYDLNTPPLRR